MRFLNNLLFAAALMLVMPLASCERSHEPEPEPEPQNFVFDNIDANYTSFTVDIIPENKDWEYVLFLTGMDYFENNDIQNEQQLFEDDYLYFSEKAAEYAEYDLTLREFLLATGWLTSGDKLSAEYVNLYPGTRYCLYCYAVEFDGDYYTPITSVSATVITTSAPELVDLKFDVSTSIDGNIAKLDVTPKGYDGYYYHYNVASTDAHYVASDQPLSDDIVALYRNRAMREFEELINTEGKTKDSFCHKGSVTIEERLQPNTDYMTLLFAVSNDAVPIMSSMPERVYFSTADMKYGDLQLDITISNVQAFSAELHITPSSDEQYACAMLAANQLPQIEDEVELMTVLIDQFMPATFAGEIDEMLTPLMPETEYVVVAFGFDGTYPTSHLFTERFTTANQEASKTYIEDIRVLHIFDVAEIAALEPKYEPLLEEAECLIVVEAITNRPCDSVYYFWYESWMMYEYSKEAFVEDLLLYKPTPSPTVVSLWYSADEFFFAGMAQDEDGNFSDVYFGEPIPILYENRSPAEEYFRLGIDIYVPEYNM